MRYFKEDFYIGILILLACCTRLPIILDGPISYDEAATVLLFVLGGPAHFLSDYSYPNNHVLHTFLVWVSISLLGNYPSSIRIPSYIAGIALIPVIYKILIVTCGDRRKGVIAACAITLSPPLISFSTYARGYTLANLILYISILIFFKSKTHSTPIPLVRTSYVSSLGVYTVPTAIVGYVGVLLFALRRSIMKFELLKIGACAALFAGFLYSPIILNQGLGVLLANPFVVPLTTMQFFSGLPRHLFESALFLLFDPLYLFNLALIIGLFSYYKFSQASELTEMLFCMGAVVVAITLLRRILIPARCLLFLLPLVYCVAAIGLVDLFDTYFRRRKSIIALFAATTLFTHLTLYPLHYRHLDGFEEAVDVAYYFSKINEKYRLNLPKSWHMPLLYYFHHLGLPFGPILSKGSSDTEKIYDVYYCENNSGEKVTIVKIGNACIAPR